MALTLKPAKFYGSSLPRPRIYTDVKLNVERVDPPVPVLDPLLSWANDALWSMGGLSFHRLRLQGKFEGNVKNLRKEIETKFSDNSPQPVSLSKKKKGGGNGIGSDSAPPAPMLKKRTQRRFESDDEEEWVDDEDEESDDDEIEFERRIKEVKRDGGLRKKRRFVRKLVDEFDSVVSDKLTNGFGVDGVALRTRSRRSVVVIDDEDGGGDIGDKSKVDNKKGDVENGKVVNKKTGKGLDSVSGSQNGSRSPPNGFDSAPPAPILKNRTLRRFQSDDEEEESDDDEIEIERIKKVKKRRIVRKLRDDFESVVSDDDVDVGNKSKVGNKKGGLENGKAVGKKNEGKGMGSDSVSGSPNGFRTSPRLKKRLN